MNNGNVYMFSPDPNAVKNQLSKSPWRYGDMFKTGQSYAKDVGFSNVGAIPVLFNYCATVARVPPVDEAVKHLWEFVDPRYVNDTNAKRRCIKLTLDFYRDLHTFGLLAKNNSFEWVNYEKGNDVGYNVDFTSSIQDYLFSFSENPGDVAIQSTVRSYKGWQMGYDAVKAARRNARKERRVWAGQIYELSNRYIKKVDKCSTSGLWMLTGAHVRELIDKVTGSDSRQAGIQARLI